MPPLSQMVPVTSVDTIAAHALKMGWMEKVFAPRPLTCRQASPRVSHFLFYGHAHLHLCQLTADFSIGQESEESYFGASWHKKFVVLTGFPPQKSQEQCCLIQFSGAPTRFPGGQAHIAFLPLPSCQVSAHNRCTHRRMG